MNENLRLPKLYRSFLNRSMDVEHKEYSVSTLLENHFIAYKISV